MSEQTYLIIFQIETDGEIFVERHSAAQLKELQKRFRFDDGDIAIVEGNLIKPFDQKIQWKQLK